MKYWQDDFYGKSGAPMTTAVKCWENHPDYLIDGMPIKGGSCTSHYPKVDVFIGLDYGMRKGNRSFPWVGGDDVHFDIADMGVPTELETFKKLIEYTAKSMKAGKSVYVGCIGGHGRTGLFFAALTMYMTGDMDAIITVRENYCKKAVESTAQIKWLNTHFGINKVAPSKGGGNVFSLGKAGKTSGVKSDPTLTIKGVSESPKAKYHCMKGKSVFVTDKSN